MNRREFLFALSALGLQTLPKPDSNLETLTRDILKSAIEIKSGEGISQKISLRRTIMTSLSSVVGGTLTETAAPKIYGQAEVTIDTTKYAASIKANVVYDEQKQAFDYTQSDNQLEIVKFVPKRFNGQREGKFTDYSANGTADFGESNLSGTSASIKVLEKNKPELVQQDYVQTLKELKNFYDSLKVKQ